MSLRLAAPHRQPFASAWLAVPLLLLSVAVGAALLAAAPLLDPLQADVPAEVVSLPPAA